VPGVAFLSRLEYDTTAREHVIFVSLLCAESMQVAYTYYLLTGSTHTGLIYAADSNQSLRTTQ